MNDKAAFFAFLEEAGVTNLDFLEEAWEEGKSFVETVKAPSSKSADWEQLECPLVNQDVAVELWWNRLTGKFKFRVRGG